MKDFLNTIAQDRITKVTTIVSLVILLITLVYVLLVYGALPPYLPLFNQLGWGDPRLGEKYLLFIPIVIALLIMIGNLILSTIVYSSMPLVSRVVTITTLLTSTLSFIFIVRVTQLVL